MTIVVSTQKGKQIYTYDPTHVMYSENNSKKLDLFYDCSARMPYKLPPGASHDPYFYGSSPYIGSETEYPTNIFASDKVIKLESTVS